MFSFLLIVGAVGSTGAPKDLVLKRNVTVSVHSATTAGPCACVAVGSAVVSPHVVPRGYNVTKMRVLAAGTFDLDGFATISWNGQISTEKLQREPENGQKDPECGFHWGHAVNLDAKVVAAFDYAHNNTIAIRASDPGSCVSKLRLELDMSNLGPYVQRLVPSLGPRGGGTPVVVVGLHFREEDLPACRFGDTLVDAHPVAEAPRETALMCVSPKAPRNGSVDVDIEVGKGHSIFPYEPSPSLPFLYYEQPKIEAVVPAIGAPDKETRVTIHGGAFFVGATGLSCRFGDLVVFARRVHDTTIECVVPPLGRHIAVNKAVVVGVAMNGVDFVENAKVSFTYVAAADELETFASQLKAIIVIVVIVAGAIVICLLVSLYRKRGDGERMSLLDDPRQAEVGGIDKTILHDNRFNAKEIEFVQRIGKGSFGEVWLALWRGTRVAVKKLPASFLGDRDSVEEFRREGQLLRILRHPNIVQWIGSTVDRDDVLLIVEFMSRGSVHDLLQEMDPDWPGPEKRKKKLPLQRRVSMLCDAARGVLYLHNCRPTVIHRDLKPRNLLVGNDWKVKICDFGLSTVVTQSREDNTGTACGTPSYSAPEILRNFRYTEKADVYSFGITMHEVYTRKTPYKGMPPFQIVFAVGTQQLRPRGKILIPAWSDLVEDCWAEDANDRPAFEEILKRLEQIDVSD